ncbi:hypothetical protein NHX12_014299 [Muraenolepis orangiensis]|uniref:GYF domain-containing protein n=1 Tax=Muraenolepis orangiensis TaxID=630683 RepID=A0A9Q0I528_9TELE|nr:hypothetical protein NHX12_014299 [Muraenolepis orangiensis]
MPKYKLAEYRYGREEMLALYIKDNKVPKDMQDKEFSTILQEEPMQPLALVPLTEEELMGKGVGGAVPTGVVRGRGAARGAGRGRGRGEGGFYQRSIEEPEVGFGRSVREIHRSQSWDDRGERRFEKPLRREVPGRPGFEDAVVVPVPVAPPLGPGRKEHPRADSDNWRTLREEQGEEEVAVVGGGEPGSSWRMAVCRRDDGGPRSAGWRDHSAPGDSRRRNEGMEDDRDGLPEWCTDEEEGEMGTFDSSGAFMPLKKGGKDMILEEEFDFQESKDMGFGDSEGKLSPPCSGPPDHMAPESKAGSAGMVAHDNHQMTNNLALKGSSMSNDGPAGLSKVHVSLSNHVSHGSHPSGLLSPPPSSAAPLLPLSGGDIEDDEGMKHLQQEAEKMVASLQDTSLEEEELPRSGSTRIPRGRYKAGYFTMTLLVKRGCDEGFQPLGDVIKMWGRVPFVPGPSPPPLLLINRCSDQGLMPSMNRSMSVPDTGSMWDMHTSASQPSGGEASLWDLTMNSSTQGPTLEQLQKLQQERRDAELRCRQQQELIMKLLQQAPQQQGPGAGGSGWGGASSSGMAKSGKPPALTLLEMHQEAERLLKQQRVQQQRDRHSGMPMGSSSMGGQWADGVGMWGGPGGMDSKAPGGGGGGSSGGMGMWDEAVKNQTGLRGNNNMGMKNSRSSPSLSDQYLMRRKRTEEEDKLLKLLQGMKPQDGFTTWCEQMLHALNTSTNNSSSSLDVATIVAYLKEVESPYAVLDFIRSYLGDTVEAKEFAKQFLERRAKQKANQQRQQQQLSKEVAGLNMNFPLPDSMRGMNPSALQSMFQNTHMGKAGLYDNQGGKMKKKQPMMLHSDPSILGYSFHNAGDCLSLNEMEMEDY